MYRVPKRVFTPAAVLFVLCCGMSSAQTVTTLGSFDGPTTGANPNGVSYKDAAGNLYGTTSYGGANNVGTVFEYVAATHSIVNLHTFDFGYDGAHPGPTLSADSHGNLFGTAAFGGNVGYGIIFEITAGAHDFKTVYPFAYGGTTGGVPSGVYVDSADNLYPTTTIGGIAAPSTYGNGVLSRFVSDGTGNYFATPRALVTFTAATGGAPNGPVLQGPDGSFYGVTTILGPGGNGTVFQLDTTRTLHTLASFTSPTGAPPLGPPVMDSAGNLFGVIGTQVYEVDAATHTLTYITQLPNDSNGALTIDSAGNLYGNTNRQVYEIDAATHTFNALATVPGNTSGPIGNLLVNGDTLYGTSFGDGDNSAGTVFAIELPVAGVPEPASALLLGVTGLPLLLWRKR